MPDKYASGTIRNRVFACDRAKRDWLIAERAIDLFDAAAVFEDPNRLEAVDMREDYGEERRVTLGRALGMTLSVVYTQRGPITWLMTAWPASRKERARYERG